MLKHTKKVMNEYCILVVKMILDFVNNNFVNVNFELLCDIEVLCGLIVTIVEGNLQVFGGFLP
jgi:hypothetical protein